MPQLIISYRSIIQLIQKTKIFIQIVIQFYDIKLLYYAVTFGIYDYLQ